MVRCNILGVQRADLRLHFEIKGLIRRLRRAMPVMAQLSIGSIAAA
jgi:hypothetical protein